jgi:hypothetical protein
MPDLKFESDTYLPIQGEKGIEPVFSSLDNSAAAALV